MVIKRKNCKKPIKKTLRKNKGNWSLFGKKTQEQKKADWIRKEFRKIDKLKGKRDKLLNEIDSKFAKKFNK
jgi:hypothetical protein